MLETWLPNLLDLFQILLLTMGFYCLLSFLKGTRTAQILVGVAAFLLLFYALTALLQLDVIALVLRWVSILLLISFLLIFHPEIRRALALLGRNQYIQILQGHLPETPAEMIVHVTRTLANRHLGALLVIQREISLDQWAATGIAIDGLLTEELLISIFTPPLPLHDGAVILNNQRICAARCILPINNELYIEGAGTRHRAALSLSHECDALILIVSEERGQISAAREGVLYRNLNDRQLERLLRAAFIPKEAQPDYFRKLFGPKHHLPWYLSFFVNKAQKLANEENDHV